MAQKIPPVPPKKMIKALEKLGFKIVRQKGSHIIMMDEKRKRVVVPNHPGKDIKLSLVRVIIKEVGISREEFLDNYKKFSANIDYDKRDSEFWKKTEKIAYYMPEMRFSFLSYL